MIAVRKHHDIGDVVSSAITGAKDRIWTGPRQKPGPTVEMEGDELVVAVELTIDDKS